MATTAKLPQRKKIRLSPECYNQMGLPCSLTFCVKKSGRERPCAVPQHNGRERPCAVPQHNGRERPCAVPQIGEVFKNNDIFTKAMMKVVYDYSKKFAFPIYACCFMPDHIHICTEATEQKSLLDFIREVKNLMIRESWKHGLPAGWLQKGGYDHFLRREENIKDVVIYIFRNPERKQLVENWKDYPYLFSTVFTKQQLLGVC